MLAGYTSLPELARHLEVDLEILRQLNPALQNPVFSGKKYLPRRYRLRLPANVGKDWEIFIAELSPRIFKHYQKRSRFYTVRKGDTAGEIAMRHGIKLRDLIAANNLDNKATIYVNRNLYIPLPGEKVPIRVSLKSSSGREKEKGDSRLPLSMAKNISADSTGEPLNFDLQPVKSREVITSPQLRQLKEKQELKSLPVLAQPNPYPEQKSELKPYSAPANQKPNASDETLVAESALSQPADKKPSQGSSPLPDNWFARYQAQNTYVNPIVVFANLAVEHVLYQRDKPIGTIRVEVEETLGHYGEWLKVTAMEIRRLNGIRYGGMIRIDQQLKIPLHRVTKEEFEEKRFEYHRELAEDFFAAYRVESVQTYSIKKGDNIWTLFREEFEVPLWLIRRYNIDVDLNTLMPSQKLLIPVVERII